MVTFSAMTGFLLTGKSIGFLSLILFMGVFFLASGASALNQYQESGYDALMERTKKRPVPSHQISPLNALVVSLVLIIVGTIFLGSIGLIPTILGISNIALYNLIYTPLKRYTWLSIIPGALVGAVPPLIGWTSGGFSIFHPIALFIAGFVFLWQIPHFWLLTLRFGQEYRIAGYPNLSGFLKESGIKVLIFIWVIITLIFLFSFHFFGLRFKPSMLFVFGFLNVFFIILFYNFLFGKETKYQVRNAFILINSFAVFIFLVLIFGSY